MIFSKSKKNDKSSVDVAFTIYENAFVCLNNSKNSDKLVYKSGNLEKIDIDFSEREKSNFDLLSKKVDIEIFKETQENNIKLSNRIYWLNWFIAFLTIVIAGAAFYEVISKIFTNSV